MDYCRFHETMCVVNKPRANLDLVHCSSNGISSKSLIVSNAGNCCQGWSSEGKRARKAHPSQHAWACWVTQRKELALSGEEDMFFQECMPLWDISSCLLQPLESSHHVVHAILGPALLGWPTSRNRVLSAGLSLQSLVWLGPTKPADIADDFAAVFERLTMLTGAVFFQEDDSVRNDWCRGKLAKKHFHGEIPSGHKLLRKILTPGQQQRLEAYQNLQAEFQALDGTFICDLDHWPNSPGPDHGPMFPVLLRHGTIFDCNTGKFAMNMDRFLSLGFHMSRKRNRFNWPLSEFVLSLSDKDAEELSGNCQSVPTILAWQLYVFCNTARKEPTHVIRPPAQIPNHQAWEEADEDQLG